MNHDLITSGRRKAVNLSLDTGVTAMARDLGINMSQIGEAALHKAARDELQRRWKQDNREAISAWHSWYEKNGDPLAHLPSL